MRRRGIVAFLGSAKLAIGLMVYLGVICFIGTLVPQGGPENLRVAAWTAGNPQWAGWARTLGVHSVYSSWYFLAGAALLAVSTMVCAWRRTKVAFTRWRLLRVARAADGGLPGRADRSVALEGASASDMSSALERADAALRARGIRGSLRGDRLIATTSPWGVWGSPVFHWALVVLFLTLATGALFRADGLMGVVQGETVKDEAAAYRVLTAGPLFNWNNVQRTIALDRLHIDYVYAGQERGTAPEVTVRDAAGAVIAHQIVYPNNALHSGSLTIHPGAWGLAAHFELAGKDGKALGASSSLLDFASEPSATTRPDDIELTGSDGNVALIARVAVPLDRKNGAPVDGLPARPVARLTLVTPQGEVVGTGTVGVGESQRMPDGSSLRLKDVTYYARLSVVDDPTIPVLYASLAAALLGVAFALLAPQRLVAVAYVDDEEGPRLDMMVRTWRNAGTSADTIRDAVARAAAGDDKGRPDDS